MRSKITFLALLAISVSSAQQGASPQNANIITPISSTIAFQGYDEDEAFVGQGEYEIYLDTDSGILDKPIILIDGFDPTDNRSIAQIYDLLDYGAGQNLANDLRDEGFDVIILNFPNYTRESVQVAGGSDYIQRNAMILVELLTQINDMKIGEEKNVVIGPSMGGLIARYALRYMEMNSLDHDTRLYLSFDAPHRGANIPIGFQHLFNYMANGPLADPTIQVVVDAMLKSPASRQMLIDQYEGHLEDGSAVEFDENITLPTGAPSFRNQFQTELDAMGFPQTTRNIAIANGSASGETNGTPGMTVMDHVFYISDSQRAVINLKFTPLAGQNIEVSQFQGQVNVFVWLTVYESAANSQSPAFMDGLDSSPGGQFDMTSLAGLAGSNALLTEFFENLEIDYFSFVPTHSALAVNGTQDWYEPVPDVAMTPFAAMHVPSANEGHVTLTTGNLAFALNEILNPPMAIGEQLFGGLQIKNPVGSELSIYSDTPIAGATISIYDISGKKFHQADNVDIEGELTIPIALSNGLYLLTIQNEQGTITKKILKN